MTTAAYIYSTLTSDNRYTNWKKGGNDMKVRGPSITIKGGANVVSKNLITPRGICTPVTAEDLKLLEENKVFQRHVKRGFITVEKSKAKADTVAKNMTAKDESAPKTPSDFSKPPVVPKSKPE